MRYICAPLEADIANTRAMKVCSFILYQSARQRARLAPGGKTIPVRGWNFLRHTLFYTPWRTSYV
ncbi:hypothetical protein [Xenorhabdus bovienii]|uniref:hypothetical protein n=1 Tax=Xenorhabdus bovienii TaxID=40576 RepID=UPI0004D49B07|nr:hypothetical protein [Xenorhabdus bovienii]CDG93962.1 hypothetical protein XBFFL1_280043 [Xenorhabdus bovienii str. feltiae Florida]